MNAADIGRLLLIDQFRRWQSGVELRVEEYSARIPELSADDPRRFELILEELGYVEHRYGFVNRDEFASRFTDLSDQRMEELRAQLAECASLADSAKVRRSSNPPDIELPAEAFEQDDGQAADDAANRRRPNPSKTITGDETDGDEREPRGNVRSHARIGRYVVRQLLGRGSFGVVYLAEDSELKRLVAVKVPSAERIKRADGRDSFLREAQLVAQLDHRGIVPVYDVGATENGECFVVSKYIEGQDLSRKVRGGYPIAAAVELVAAIARARRGSGFLYEDFSLVSPRRQQVLLTARSQVVSMRVARTLPRK